MLNYIAKDTVDNFKCDRQIQTLLKEAHVETDVLLLDEKTCLARYGMKRSSFRIWAERCGAAVKLDGCKRYAWKLLDAEVERQLAEQNIEKEKSDNG